MFVTKYGNTYDKDSAAITKEFGKVLNELELHRRELGFYTLRHVFRTVADGCRDFPAVQHIMGHADNSIDGVYQETIDDDRLRAVADHVRDWLWPAAETELEAEADETGKQEPSVSRLRRFAAGGPP